MLGQNVSLKYLTNPKYTLNILTNLQIIIIIITIILKRAAISFLLLNTRLPDRNVSGP